VKKIVIENLKKKGINVKNKDVKKEINKIVKQEIKKSLIKNINQT
jgi:hypothetical protein